jgi:hypothetical protein
MKRFHVHMAIKDLAESVRLYSALSRHLHQLR